MYFYYDKDLHSTEYNNATVGKINFRIELREDGRDGLGNIDNFLPREPFRPFSFGFDINAFGTEALGEPEGDGAYSVGDYVTVEINMDDTSYFERWTKLNDDGSQVRRRRECIACGERHSTRETVDLNLPRLIKSDDSRQTFSEDKLRSGLLKALEKRPVEISKIETAIQKIQRRLMAQNDREVPSSILGEWVMEELRALDEVAYIRFASVYRQFQDIEAFKSEIDKLMNK